MRNRKTNVGMETQSLMNFNHFKSGNLDKTYHECALKCGKRRKQFSEMAIEPSLEPIAVTQNDFHV